MGLNQAQLDQLGRQLDNDSNALEILVLSAQEAEELTRDNPPYRLLTNGEFPLEASGTSGLLDPLGSYYNNSLHGFVNSALQLWVCSVSSDGRRVVIEVRGRASPALPSTLRRSSAPAGFLMLELAGPGPNFELTLSVLRSRLQCLGDFEEQRDGVPGRPNVIKWQTESTPRTVNGVAGKDYVCTAVGIEQQAPQDGYIPFSGSGWVGGKRKNRLVALVFDETDTLVELAYSAEYFVEYNYPAFNGSVEGAVSGWLADSSPYTNSNISNSVVGQFSRISTEIVHGEIALLRDGVEVSRGGFRLTQTINERFTYSPSYTQTPDLTRVGDTVVGGGLRQLHEYDYHSDMNCAGATWRVSTVSSAPGFTYNAPLWAGFRVISSDKPFGYVVSMNWGNTSNNEYAGANVDFQRFSNCLMGALEQARKGVRPGRFLTRHVVGPRASWSNPGTEDESGGMRASYHPVTHEIYATASNSDSAEFCWI
ncbi:hypothetical protein [Pseudomonas sp. NBRC 100443]|uniref:hypothetical protein n=1 Tax=Pseudomonas sp. NBRC 100443 TaxID=1113665 RepID=UPI0024A4D3EC|nr:hypothetical protein [Pseudomonas sp. NBRC 100443]GLU41096.1 hypothetical protein Pssp01_51890 [Pseudomonas sp. NBRC 100443]